jgi:hypothetical protein
MKFFIFILLLTASTHAFSKESMYIDHQGSCDIIKVTLLGDYADPQDCIRVKWHANASDLFSDIPAIAECLAHGKFFANSLTFKAKDVTYKGDCDRLAALSFIDNPVLYKPINGIAFGPWSYCDKGISSVDARCRTATLTKAEKIVSSCLIVRSHVEERYTSLQENTKSEAAGQTEKQQGDCSFLSKKE